MPSPMLLYGLAEAVSLLRVSVSAVMGYRYSGNQIVGACPVRYPLLVVGVLAGTKPACPVLPVTVCKRPEWAALFSSICAQRLILGYMGRNVACWMYFHTLETLGVATVVVMPQR